ncbi:hypothetical protein CCACVL1_06159 [Corchorus capsularis]|uniref:Uncharacterized protein n=1 Tax=Corchorus capsularis TaxID=210143 RepID=A0A1R3JH12_COCAP|nr:hypothetical protein CCACVL1_06159 [Corchorus capsularis]
METHLPQSNWYPPMLIMMPTWTGDRGLADKANGGGRDGWGGS